MNREGAQRLVVRRAVDADVPSLLTLRAAWRGASVAEDFAAEFAAWFQREASQRWWWIAEDDAARAIGMVNLKIFERMPSPEGRSSRWGYLANLFVDEPFRTQGVATQLLQALLSTSVEEGLARVVLSPSEQSLPLYRRAGFTAADMLLVWQPAPRPSGPP